MYGNSTNYIDEIKKKFISNISYTDTVDLYFMCTNYNSRGISVFNSTP